ncbi:MAG: hypothetical protein IPO18_03550 [bacterium]|nr:hypothetical protein [bacterium]MBK9471348.1 hypothetical protein [bacterium]
MTDKARVRPRIGDVVRIVDASGAAAYAQYTHRHKMYGPLLRVLGPASAPASIAGDTTAAELAAMRTQFVTFFPLGAACHRGIAQIVGQAPVPAEAQSFPVFRATIRFPNGSGSHWLWDGDRQWRIDLLSQEHRALPPRAIVNDTLLVERAHAGWRHEDEF